jgi:hypothetical protein
MCVNLKDMPAPEEIAAKGERLYKERFQAQYELAHPGKFLAIDIMTEPPQAYLANTPEAALEQAQKTNPKGFFHVVRIGAPGVYRVGYTRGVSGGWRL